MKKEKLSNIEFVRSVCAIIIVYFHFIAETGFVYTVNWQIMGITGFVFLYWVGRLIVKFEPLKFSLLN